MEINTLRQQIVDTGITLLKSGLVARTWGNVSARVDEGHLLITPSGLSYTETTPEDLALYDMVEKTYEGKFKPSSEKGVHAGAYELLKDANFVIHTHQTYASAIGVYGFDSLIITDEERTKLGGIALADYGLPGTKKLKNAVRACFEKGAHTVLMKNHGAVVAGADKEEAMARINLLEDICKRNVKGLVEGETPEVTCSKLGKPIVAQLDDMAQMIGRFIPFAKSEEEGLKNHNAVMVKGQGIFVRGMDEDDTEALKILAHKAAVTFLHVNASGAKRKLSSIDCMLMNFVYKKKYSKKKDAKREGK